MNEEKGAPKALICDECFDKQRKANVSGEDEFYCKHHHVWAIRRPDGGWLLSTQVSPEDHLALVEDARQLQKLDEPVPVEVLATSLH